MPPTLEEYLGIQMNHEEEVDEESFG